MSYIVYTLQSNSEHKVFESLFHQNYYKMNIQILISKKGTQVVRAAQLHDALELAPHKYKSHLSKWLTDFYAFSDDIRQPILLKDFAKKESVTTKSTDYYLSLELARMITLNSESKVKQKYAKWLMSFENPVVNDDLLTKEQVLAVVELTKVMGLVSCQKSAERQHMKSFEKVYGKANSWWNYRAKVLGYSVEELKSKMVEVGKTYKGKNLLQMLMTIDKYEIIRLAVIDLFLALGKSKRYAKNLGDLAKVFAKEMKIEIWDDRKSAIDFSGNNVNLDLINEVRGLQKGSYLAVL